MKHPNPDEWAQYVSGESPSARARELKQHLGECETCAAQIVGWERTLKRLDRWAVPKTRRRSNSVPFVVRWAAAAALLLGIGFGLGVFVNAGSSKRAQKELEATLHASLAAELRADLQREIDQRLMPAVAAVRAEVAGELRQQFARDLAQAITASAQSSDRELQRVSGEFFQALENGRETDRRVVFALIEQIQKQQSADYVSLRKDLETMAALTDDEIRGTRLSLRQLVANTTVPANFSKP